MARNYKKEYANYQGRPEQIKRRDARNKARNQLSKEGKVHKGDGKDVDHKNSNPLNDSRSNLRVLDKSTNRSFPRNKNAQEILDKRHGGSAPNRRKAGKHR